MKESSDAKNCNLTNELFSFLNASQAVTKEEIEDKLLDSDTDSQAHLSDDEDICCMQCVTTNELPEAYRETFSDRTREAVKAVFDLLRDAPLLPLKPAFGKGSSRRCQHANVVAFLALPFRRLCSLRCLSVSEASDWKANASE